jgi:hypothetical protein
MAGWLVIGPAGLASCRATAVVPGLHRWRHAEVSSDLTRLAAGAVVADGQHDGADIPDGGVISRADMTTAFTAARRLQVRATQVAPRRAVTAVAVALFIWILPLAAAGMAIGTGATEMGQSMRAADGQGVPGVVVPTDENCGGTPPCSWTGNFTSSSGRLRLKNVDISSGAQEVGKPFAGLYEGSTFFGNQVYPYGSHEWIWDIWFLVFGAMMLILPAGVTIGWWRTRRRRALPPGRHARSTS